MKYTDRQIKLAYKNGVLETIKNSMIEEEISKKYSIGSQIAIIRQKDIKPEEFNEFYTYTESCKTKVKDFLTESLSLSSEEINNL